MAAASVWPRGRPLSAWRPALARLGFREKGDIFEAPMPNGGTKVRGDILPLPSETETGPNLFIRPCPAAAQGRKGALVNRKEIGL